VLLSILVFALLVPTGLLFAQTWRDTGDRARATALELDGVAYLRSLQQVALALNHAQSAAVTGTPAPPNELTVAVEQAAATDARLGSRLRTTDRWNGVRARIDSLRDNTPADPVQALAAFREVGDLVLALYAKVRDQSGLVHDPDDDAFHLQNSAAGELPVAVISAGRLADIAMLAAVAQQPRPGQPPADPNQQLTLVAGLAAERATLLDASTRLVEDLRSAVDSTESRTLGSNLLSRLDRFERATDVVDAISGQVDGTATGDPSRIVLARAEIQSAMAELSTTILTEVEHLLNARADSLDDARLRAGGAAGAAVLLTICFLLLLFLSGPSTKAPPPPVEAAPAPVTTPAIEWERSGAAR